MHSLNKIYRIIWSEALNAWVAVSELVKSKGKRSGASLLRILNFAGVNDETDDLHRHRFKLALLAASCLLTFQAHANPMGGNVVNGQASFNTSGNTLTVTNTPGAIIHWQDFSIQQNEITRFAQQSASSAVLNRVVGGNTSQILGSLQSNGRVFLVNPNGIVFGQGATIDVAGLVATSLNLSDADFLVGRHRFTSDPNAQTVSNAGNITAQQGGEIWLIAPNVENSGVITAPNGEILLAAGASVELVNSLDPALRVNITAPAGDATNVGQLVASAGKLGLFGTVVRNSGQVSADSATLQGGKIVFKSSQRTEISGTTSARGVGGGEIKVLSDMQQGTVSVSGTLDASAPQSGDGGFIDTSAAHLDIAPTASIKANATSGQSGEWLIDPLNVTIGIGVSPADAFGTFIGGVWTPTGTGSFITTGTIQTALNGGTSVTITTVNGGVTEPGDINVNSSLTKTTGVAATLTLNAENNINFANGAGVSSTSGALNLVLHSDSDGSGVGTVAFAGGNTFSLLGGRADIYYNPVSYTDAATKSDSLTNPYSAVFGATPHTAWMLVNDVNQLQVINTNREGNYALGANIDATVTSGWNAGAGFVPLGSGITFNGQFDGLGHTISNLSINRPLESYVGLFRYLAGTVRNVELVNASVVGGNLVGGLVGYNSFTGKLDSSGSVGGNVQGGNSVGGLIGSNYGGSISNSYASSGAVIGTQSVGGLIGSTFGNGTLTNSHYDINAVTINGTNVVTLGGLYNDNTASFNGFGQYTDWLVNGSKSLSIVNYTSPYGSFGNGGVNIYTISDAQGLKDMLGFADNPAYTFTLSNSVVTAPAGWYIPELAANFDGGNSTLSDLNISQPFNDNLGLFGHITLGTTVSNLSLVNTTLSGASNVGALAGWNKGLISNSSVSGSSVTGVGTAIGGLVGNNNGTINSSSFAQGTSVTGSADVGGLVGKNTGTLDGNWVSTGNVNGTSIPSRVGGLVGSNASGGTISNNTVDTASVVNGVTLVGGLLGYDSGEGVITGNTVTATTVNGNDYVGGLVGQIATPPTSAGSADDNHVVNSFVNGGVVIGGLYVGGLIGWNGGAVSNSSVSGGTVSGSSSVGGLVGYNSGSISNSYVGSCRVSASGSMAGGLVGSNAGSISNSYVSGGSVSAASTAGGLVGVNTSTGSISNSYASIGSVSAGFSVGGLVGIDNGSTINSFWDSDLLPGVYAGGGIGNPLYVTGLTTAQTKQLVATTAALGATGQITDTGGTTGMTWRIYEGQTTPLLMSFLKPLTVTADSVSKIYDGATYSGGLVNPVYTPLAPDLTHMLGTANAYGPNAINVGTYNPALYSDQLGYDLSFVGGVLTVTPASLTLLSVTANDVSKTYGTTYSFAGTEFTPVGLVNGDTITNVTLTSAGAVNTAVVGPYPINVTPGSELFGQGSAANYTISYLPGTLTVNPLVLAVTADAQNKIYGGIDPALTYNAPGLLFTDVLNGSLTRVAGENVGSYAINLGTLANPNYTISYTGANLTITPASLNLLSVTANNANKTYGTTYSFAGTEFTPVGLVNGDTITNVTLTSAGAVNTAVVGPYPINVTPGSELFGQGSAANYTISYLPGTLTVNPLALAVTADAQNKIYGGIDPALTYNAPGLLFTDVLSGSLTRVAGENVGSYAINLGTLANPNYTISYTGANLTITPASLNLLSVTANNANKTYGTTYSFAGTEFTPVGLVNGDTITNVTLTSAGAVNTAVVGPYPINVTPGSELFGQGSAANYTISYLPGTLTVNPLALAVTADAQNKIYGGIDPALTYNAPGLLFTDVLSGSLTRVAGENVGSYAINLGTLANPNYTISYTGANLTITPFALTVSASGVNRGYDGTTGATVTLTDNRITGDILTTTYGSAAFFDKNVGTNKTVNVGGINVTGTDAGNYTFNSTAATTANISQLASVTWTGGSGNLWATGVNWSDGALPDGMNVAAVVIPSGATVVYDSSVGSTTLNTLTNNGSLTIAGGSLLTVLSSMSNTSNFTLNVAGTLSTGTATNTGTINIANGTSPTLNASSLNNQGTINIGDVNSTLSVSGTLNNQVAINSVGTTGSRTLDAGTLLNSGTITVTYPMTVAGVFYPAGTTLSDTASAPPEFEQIAGDITNIVLNSDADIFEVDGLTDEGRKKLAEKKLAEDGSGEELMGGQFDHLPVCQ